MPCPRGRRVPSRGSACRADGAGVAAAHGDDRLSRLGLFTEIENDTTCCYALQEKVWVHGPGAEPGDAACRRRER